MLPACHTLLQLAMLMMAVPTPVDGWAAHPEEIIQTAYILAVGSPQAWVKPRVIRKGSDPSAGCAPQAHSLRTSDTFV